jgi:hypothetical protein
MQVFRLFVTCLALALLVHAADVSDVLGTWEGESVCVVENPCHTEHVIYDIVPRTGTNAVTVRADKVVNGKREFMGSIDCVYDPAQHRLACPVQGRKAGDWVFTVAGDIMTGTATLREGKQLFRNIHVKRQKDAR